MRIVIFGNSGSGKSTLAKQYAKIPEVAHLDLDSVAWKADETGVREDLATSKKRIGSFVTANENWVVEGCYSSLISIVLEKADEIVFLNPGIETCQGNFRSRPWESHKYKSKEDQDKNLEMLLNWVSEYESRTDEFSLSEHKALFEAFKGKKLEISSNTEAQNKASEAII